MISISSIISVIFLAIILHISFLQTTAGKDPFDNPFDAPKLNDRFLDRFIIIPEYKLMFCYIEKVGCTSFNHLFTSIRKQDWHWFQNSPQALNYTKSDLEWILSNPEWQKAVFYRHPLDRVLSAYKSKCEWTDNRDSDGNIHCQMALNDPTIARSGNNTKDFAKVIKYLKDNDNPDAKDRANPHWAPQSEFCGGLTRNLQYYQTVEFFHPNNLRAKVVKLLYKSGLRDVSKIQNFEETFTGSEYQKKRWTHAEQHALDYYWDVDFIKTVLHYYITDYLLFGIPIRGWALNFLEDLF